MKCVFQFVSGEDGRRSHPLTLDRVEFAQGIKADVSADNEKLDSDMILVLAEIHDGDDGEPNVRWSTCPLMTVRTFIDNFGGSDNG